MDYAWSRHYTLTWGRFVQADPHRGSAALENPQSWNSYAYVQDDPVNFNERKGPKFRFGILPTGSGTG